MNSTKTISLRIDRAFYNEIIRECDIKGINITEWIERKIAHSDNLKSVKKELLLKLSLLKIFSENKIDNLNYRIKQLSNYVDENL